MHRNYTNTYECEKNSLTHQLYEKQNQHYSALSCQRAQQKHLSNLMSENETIQAILRMYTARFDTNQAEISKIDQASYQRNNQIQLQQTEIAELMSAKSTLDSNYREFISNNAKLQCSYANLIRNAVSVEQRQHTSKEKSQVTKNLKANEEGVLSMIYELKFCVVCYNSMTTQINQCLQGHVFCSSCTSKLTKCPICCQQDRFLSSNRVLEDIIQILTS